MPPVVVTATSSERTLEHVPASVSVIGGDSLRSRPVNDLSEMVGGAVGLDILDLGLGRQGISVRGMNPGHTLVLVDGRRINSSAAAIAHSDFELGWIPAEAIERVEVIRGPMSSLYGSEALGGVVNVITRSATDVWQGSVNASAMLPSGGLGGKRYKAGFYVAGPLSPGRLGLNLWGEVRHRAALDSATDRKTTVLDRLRATTGHVGLNWTPDRHQRIEVSMTAGSEDQEGSRSGKSRTGKTYYESSNDVQRRRYALSYSGNWSRWSSQLRLYRSTLERKAYRSDGADTTGPNHLVDTVFDGKFGVLAGKVHQLTAGFETRRESLEDPAVNRAGKKAVTHFAFFGQDEMVLGNHWEVVLGSRFDHHEDFGWEVSPRVYALYHANEALTFKAGLGRGFKAPTLKQLSPEYESRAAMGGRGIIRGNLDLQPETNRSAEVGVTYARDGWSSGLTLFRNDVHNLIDIVRQPACSERGKVCLNYKNVSRARLQGAELTLGAQFDARWRADANYTYLDAQDRTGHTRLEDRARHLANVTLAWTPHAAVTTRLRAQYKGAAYRGATLADSPAFTLLHWYIDYDINRRFALHAGIENIGNKRLGNDRPDRYDHVDEGRRYFVGLTARF